MQSATRAKELKDQIQELVIKAYLECGVDVAPKKHTYLIRVLPKEQVTQSGIILADMGNKDHQNKPVYEALVLATYSPYIRTLEAYMVKSKDLSGSELIEELIVPEFGVGDHILFPHYEGTPIPHLDLGKGDYRIIREEVIVCKLEYESRKVEEQLREGVLHWLGDAPYCDKYNAGNLAKWILERFNVVSKGVMAKTLSGE